MNRFQLSLSPLEFRASRPRFPTQETPLGLDGIASVFKRALILEGEQPDEAICSAAKWVTHGRRAGRILGQHPGRPSSYVRISTHRMLRSRHSE
jgi:hypothetical protein